MENYVVLDKFYTQEEGQDCFCGTLEECQDFVSSQSDYFMYEIIPESALYLNNQ